MRGWGRAKVKKSELSIEEKNRGKGGVVEDHDKQYQN